MRKVSRSIVLLLTLTLLTLTACASTSNQQGGDPASGQNGAQGEPKYGGSLRFAAIRDATTFDPHQAGGISNYWLLGSIYDKLVTYATTGQFEAALAESWEQTDPVTYVFKLRQGVKFHDGTAFDAADVVASLNRIKNPETAAARFGSMKNIKDIATPDPYTVSVTLAEPDSTFLHALASNTAYILSATDVESGFDFKSKTNGTSAFILDNWEPQRQYVLKKNPNYYVQGLPYLDELVLKIVTDEKARTDALRTNEADIAEYVPWQEMDALERDFTVVRHYGANSFIRVNQAAPPLDDKRVRQALGYIIDRQEVLDLAFGGQGVTMTGSLQPHDDQFYVPELKDTYTKDWEKARALLKEAGYNSPADVPPLEFSVSSSAVSAQPGKVIHQQLQDFGLRVTWKTVDVPTLQENRRNGTYQIHMDGGGMSWPDPDYLRQIFHSVSGSTHAVGVKYKNERLDELLTQGSQVSSVAERKAIYREAEQILLDEAPWIWVLWRPQAEAHAKYVKGYAVHPSALGTHNVGRFERVWLDK